MVARSVIAPRFEFHTAPPVGSGVSMPIASVPRSPRALRSPVRDAEQTALRTLERAKDHGSLNLRRATCRSVTVTCRGLHEYAKRHARDGGEPLLFQFESEVLPIERDGASDILHLIANAITMTGTGRPSADPTR